MLKAALLAADVQLDAVTSLLDGGSIELYTGRPPNEPADGVPPASVLLARLRLANPAFEQALGGEAIARQIGPERAAPGEGRATWFRCSTADGRPILDGSAGAPGSGSECEVETEDGGAFVAGGTVVSCPFFLLAVDRVTGNGQTS